MKMQKLLNMVNKYMDYKKLSLLIIVFVYQTHDTFSQCALCKAAVEANLDAGETKGAGLNSGILYLMAVPYIAVGVFAILWYIQNKKKAI